MADLPHNFTEFQGSQTHNSATWTVVTNQNITSGNFVVGRKYLIYATNKFEGRGLSEDLGTRILHGTTVFPESNIRIQSRGVSEEMHQYKFLAVWTAVSGEGISMEASRPSGSQANFVKEASIFTLEISEELTENTDWHFNENFTEQEATTSFSTTNNATITFTPPSAGDDWLIIGVQKHTGFSTVTSIETRMRRTGEATENGFIAAYEGESSGDTINHLNCMVKNLGASSNTFEMQFRNTSGTQWDRGYGLVFAINLSKFTSHVIQHDESSFASNNTNFDISDDPVEIMTQDFTPATAGDVWSFFWSQNNDFTVVFDRARLQIDNVDNPPGQTALNMRQGMGHDGGKDQLMFNQQTVDNLTAASHTWDIDWTHINTDTWAFDSILTVVRLEVGSGPPQVTIVVPGSKVITTDP